MGSQPVEVIDLTNDTGNVTITLDDTLPSPILSSPSPEPIEEVFPSPTFSTPKNHRSKDSFPSPIIATPSSQPTYNFQISPVFSSPSPQGPKTNFSSPILSTPSSQPTRAELQRLKKIQKEEEKLVKEANKANAANKALENCTAIIDKSILELISDPEEIILKTLADESLIKYRLTEFPKIDKTISWSYKTVEVVDGACVPRFKDSGWIIYVMSGAEYLKMLLSYKTDPENSLSINNFLIDLRRRSDSDTVLMVYNLANHLKSERMKEARNYRKTFKDAYESNSRTTTIDITEESSASSLGPTDLQDLRLMLELDLRHEYPGWKLHFEFHENTQAIVKSIVRYTLSVARYEVKRKLQTSTGLDWAINMDKERAVDPTKSSEDLTRLWVTQLQQFPQVTLPIAKAIAAEYPSPCALVDQYNELDQDEAENLLAQLYVQRNLKRQIGSNISKRIHRFITCEDPDVHIGIN